MTTAHGMRGLTQLVAQQQQLQLQVNLIQVALDEEGGGLRMRSGSRVSGVLECVCPPRERRACRLTDASTCGVLHAGRRVPSHGQHEREGRATLQPLQNWLASPHPTLTHSGWHRPGLPFRAVPRGLQTFHPPNPSRRPSSIKQIKS